MERSVQDSPERFDSVRPWRSPAYLAFVRTRPCVVTGREGEEVVAHHVRCLGGGGMGLKPPDWMCLPITAVEHSKLHQTGEASYWKARGIDPVEMICMTLLVRLAARPSADLARALAAIVSGSN